MRGAGFRGWGDLTASLRGRGTSLPRWRHTPAPTAHQIDAQPTTTSRFR
jgi:hypothetical protein